MSIPIFAHPSFLNKTALLSSPDRQAIYKCVEKLRNKQWDAGLRAKRLKGFSQRIWEARTDRGDRLLFTFGREGIRLWELASHDDVERMNRRSFTEDSPFVSYPSLEDAPSLQENESLSDWIERDLEEDSFLPIEIDQELWRPLDREELLRLSHGDDLVHKIELRLTEEQKKLVEKPGNILLSGTAGSGKTTVAVFRLLDLANRNSGKILYLAQNPWLVRYARDLFEELLPADRREDETIWKHIFFKSVQEVAGEMFKEAPQPVGYPFFKLLFKRWPDRVLPPATAWSEIRSIVKGACLDPSRDFLDKESYLNIGKKRAPDLQEFRPELFRNAERYQKHLMDHRMLDAVDLIRRALRSLTSEERGGYAAILLDEVQDFTELHLELAFRLLDRSGTLFCTGDLNQVINPSGFRWEEVKKQFFRRSMAIPELKSLSTNFRSAGSIVELSEGLLEFRQRLLGGLSERAQSACLQSGDIPGLIENTVEKKEIFEAIRGMAGDSAVLVRSETEKERIFFETGCEFVFTVEEAKGLEFDTVLIWDFFNGEKDLWNKSLRGKILAKDRPALRYEINLLYVAATRPRRKLRIFDPGGLLWEEPELRGKTIEVRVEDLSSLAHPLSPAEWGERGSYFFAHEFFDQAITCFQRAGEKELASRARAAKNEQSGNWAEAARIYEEMGDRPAFGRCFAHKLEAEGKNEAAAFQWLALDCLEKAQAIARKSKNRELLGLIEAASLEKNEDFAGAAKKYEQLSRFDQAAENWELEGEKSRAAIARWQAYRKEATPERLHWFEKAAEGGNVHSQFFLSLIFASLDGEKARHWTKLAAQGGHAEAQYHLGIIENDAAWFYKASEQGHPEAQLKLACLFSEENPAEAEKYFRKAAEGGIMEARFRLASLLAEREENEEARKFFQLAAEAGHTESQCCLGRLLERENPTQAMKWLRKAAEKGHPQAHYLLGRLYLEERQNPSKAKESFLKALEIPEAAFELGEMFFEDQKPSEAEPFYRKAAEAGHVGAQYSLGYLLDRGEGVQKNREEAEKWFLLAAEKGSAGAQFEMGELAYYQRDFEKAREWYHRAADQDHPDAQYSLGFMHEGGKGLPRDLLEAAVWYRKAAEREHLDAEYRLGLLLVQEEPEQAKEWLQKAADRNHPAAQFELSTLLQDNRKSLFWCQKSAELGNVDAQYKLGFRYLHGQEIPQDLAKAAHWLTKAAEQGDEMSQVNLGHLYEQENDLEKAAFWYRKAAEAGDGTARERLASLEKRE